MKRLRDTVALGVTLILGGAALVGCTTSGYPDPYGDRGPEDSLPASVDEADEYDYSTSLKAASYDGTDVYLVWPSYEGPNTGGAPCLALVAATSSIACSGNGSVQAQMMGGPEFALHPAGAYLGSDWESLSENVSVLD